MKLDDPIPPGSTVWKNNSPHQYDERMGREAECLHFCKSAQYVGRVHGESGSCMPLGSLSLPPAPPSRLLYPAFFRYPHSIGRSDPVAPHIILAPITLCNHIQGAPTSNHIPFRLHIYTRASTTSHQVHSISYFFLLTAVTAMATGVAELASAAFASAVVVKTPWQQGQSLRAQAAPRAVCRRSSAVMAQRQMAEEESVALAKRSTLLSTAMALAGAAMVAGAVAGSAEAAIQKVEGTEREEQDAVTTGIREPPSFGSAKDNTVKDAAKINTQASGGLILGAPKLDEPAGAYRSPQSSTYGVDQTGGKRSTPAGILQGNSDGKSGSPESAVIGGDATESK